MTRCMSNKMELLAPAGGRASLNAAVECGADAVYMGGKSFNARQNAENFDDAGLGGAIDYCHARGVKVFVTLNTLYKSGELGDVLRLCGELYRQGADAFIMQDIGAAVLVREKFPGIKIFASTQLTVKTAADAEFLIEKGFSRIILSREAGLDEIRRVSELGVETEVFIHGALCYCYSGQCLLSSMLGGRSGNRGSCAQPCRLGYELLEDGRVAADGYLLSPKDMMTIDMLPEIAAAGVRSLKIEGRMKSPEYVAMVTKAYRGALDGVPVSDELRRDLTQIFNRGGSFNQSYFNAHSGAGMMSRETPKSTGVLIGEVVNYIPQMKKCTIRLRDNAELVGGDGVEIWTKHPHVGASYNSSVPAEGGSLAVITVEGRIEKGDLVYKSYDKRLNDRLKKLAVGESRKLTINGGVTAHPGKPLELRLSQGGTAIKLSGAEVQHAQKQPVTAERLLSQLKKTGATPYRIEFSDVDISDSIFIDMKSVNDLRRDAVSEFERAHLASFKREPVCDTGFKQATPEKCFEPGLAVYVHTPEQMEAALNSSAKRVYFPPDERFIGWLGGWSEKAHARAISLYAALRHTEPSGLDEIMDKPFVDGYLAGTYGHLLELSRRGNTKPVVLDYSFNVMNAASRGTLAEYGVITPSLELNTDELRGMCGKNTELVVYGRVPLMLTRQCPVGLYKADKKPGKFCACKNKAGNFSLRDRKKLEFPVITDCEACTAQILNAKVLDMSAKSHELFPIGAEYWRVLLWTESGDEAARILNAFGAALRHEPVLPLSDDCTYGHFFRGV